MLHQVSFDFYGTTIRVQSPSPSCLSILETEFDYFKAEVAKTDFNLELFLESAPEGILPQIPCSKITQNSLTYDQGPVRWNDYHGKALTYYDYDTQQGVIWCQDPNLQHEIAYLMILSLTGKELDLRGFHKVHACGIRYQGRNILVMLPSMGGKTTLFLELARFPGVSLISDDTPLISPSGEVLPFPLRIGVEKIPSTIKGEFAQLKRQHHSSKFLIPLSTLGAPIAYGATGSTILIFGKRWHSALPHLRRLSPLESLKGLVEHMVVGVGLPMVVEYFVRHTPRDWIKLFSIGLKRLRAALRLWQQGESWEVLLGDHSQSNAEAILSLLKKRAP